MKKFYEAPSAEELVISSADILTGSNIAIDGSDPTGSDEDWGLLD